MKTVTIRMAGDRKSYTGGTELEALDALRLGSPFTENIPLGQYLDNIARDVAGLLGVHVPESDGTLADRARKLLDALVKHNLATRREAAL